MATEPDASQAIVEALKKKKALTLKDLCQSAQRSPMTLWRILKPVGYYTSFNHNGRFYTLGETPQFDANGLWFWGDVGFSSARTLYQTLVSLVSRAKRGMTPSELSEILRTRVQNQLYHLFSAGKVERAQWGRAHLYLSIEESARKAQLAQREASKGGALALAPAQPSPSESETIAILAELVRSPRSTARHLAALLEAKGLAITQAKVLTVIDKYDLKKKGRHSRRSRR